jgi:hypothetical protein
MRERIYSGTVALLDENGCRIGAEVVKFVLGEVVGLSIMDGAGMAAPAYFVCLNDFTQVQVYKHVFDRLIDAGKRVESLV